MSTNEDENLLKELETLGALGDEESTLQDKVSPKEEKIGGSAPNAQEQVVANFASHQSYFIKEAKGAPLYCRRFNEDYCGRHGELGEVWLKEVAGLCHPYLVPIVKYGWSANGFYYQRPWIKGKPLTRALQESQDRAEKLRWIAQLFLLWDYLSFVGRGHGALTSENLWVDTQGELKVTDPMLAPFLEEPSSKEPWSKKMDTGLGGLELSFSQDRFSLGLWLMQALGLPLMSVQQYLLKLSSFKLGGSWEIFLQKLLAPKTKLFARDFLTEFFELFPQGHPQFLPPNLEVLSKNLAWVRLFRQILITGQTWALDCPSPYNRFILTAWIKRYFAINQKSLLYLKGESLCESTSYYSLPPNTVFLIAEAQAGPAAAWVEARGLKHVIFLGADLENDLKEIKLSPQRYRLLASNFFKAETWGSLRPSKEVSLLSLSEQALPSSSLNLTKQDKAQGLVENFRRQGSAFLKAYFSPAQDLLKSFSKEEWVNHVDLLMKEEAWEPSFRFIGLGLQYGKFAAGADWSLKQAFCLAKAGKAKMALSRLNKGLIQDLDKAGQARAYEALGLVSALMRKSSSVLGAYKKAYQLYGEVKSYEGAVRTLITWAHWHLKNHQIKEAQPLLEKVGQLLEKFQAVECLKLDYLVSLMDFYAQATDFDQAKEHFKEAKLLLKNPDNFNRQAALALVEARLYFESSQTEEAEESIQRALPWAYLFGQSSWIFQLESFLAFLSSEQMGSAQTWEYWSRALWAARKGEDWGAVLEALLNRAQESLYFRRHEAAFEDLVEAQGLAEEAKETEAYLHAALLQAKALRAKSVRPQALKSHWELIEKFWQKTPIQQLAWLYYWELGEFYRSEGKEKQAKEALEKALKQLEAKAQSLRPSLRKRFLQDGKLEELKSLKAFLNI